MLFILNVSHFQLFLYTANSFLYHVAISTMLFIFKSLTFSTVLDVSFCLQLLRPHFWF